MPTNPLPYAALAVRHLKRRDPTLVPIIQRIGPFRPKLVNDPFTALVRSLLPQQISTKAAASIYTRLTELVGVMPLTPPALSAIPAEALRTVGLSRAKALYVHDLASKVAEEIVPL